MTFVSNATDMEILDKIQARFEVAITDMPAELDKNSYSMSISPLLPQDCFAKAFLSSSDCLNTNPAHVLFELQEVPVPLAPFGHLRHLFAASSFPPEHQMPTPVRSPLNPM